MKELKLCPFCGGEAIRTALKLKDMDSEKRIECMKCEAQTKAFYHYCNAQSAWNKRVIE